MADIGNVHLESEIPVLQTPHPYRVIKVPGAFSIDGDDIEITKIAPPGQRQRIEASREKTHFVPHLAGKAVREVKFSNDDLYINTEIRTLAEDLNHPPARQFQANWKTRYFDGDDHPVEFPRRTNLGRRKIAEAFGLLLPGRKLVAGRNGDRVAKPFVVRCNKAAGFGIAKHANDKLVRTPEDFLDPALGAAVFSDTRYPDQDAIVVHRFAQRRRRDEHVRAAGQRLVRDHETETIAMPPQSSASEFRI